MPPSLRLPPSLSERLRREAYETRLSQSEIIRVALAEYFERGDQRAERNGRHTQETGGPR